MTAVDGSQEQHPRSQLCINNSHNAGTAAAVTASTMSPGHESILEAHANSQWNAAVYVAIVLLIYALALLIVTVQRVRSERSQVRLAILYHNFWRRNSSSKQKAPIEDEEDEEEIAPVPVVSTCKAQIEAECAV